MPEAVQIGYSHRELATLLVKDQEIHEGIWGVWIRFGLRGANVGGEGELLPSAIVPVLEIGLQRMDSLSTIAVDASEVNPRAVRKVSSKRRRR